MFVSALVGVKVNLSIKYETVNNKPTTPYHYFKIDISVGPKGGKFKAFKFTSSYGAFCIPNNTRLLLLISKEKSSLLSSGFKLTFNSGKFGLTKSFDQEIDVKDNQKVCFLFGSWLPHDRNTKVEAEVFLNFLTQKTDTNNRSLYLATLDFQFDHLKIGLELLPELLGLSINESRMIQVTRTNHRFPLVAKSFEKQQYVENYLYIRETLLTYDGDGQLFFPLLADSDDEGDIAQALKEHKKNCQNSERFDQYLYPIEESPYSPLRREWKGVTFSSYGMMYKQVHPSDEEEENRLVV